MVIIIPSKARRACMFVGLILSCLDVQRLKESHLIHAASHVTPLQDPRAERATNRSTSLQQYSYLFYFDIVAHNRGNNPFPLLHIRKTPGGGIGSPIHFVRVVSRKRGGAHPKTGSSSLTSSRFSDIMRAFRKEVPRSQFRATPLPRPVAHCQRFIGWCTTAPGERMSRT